MESILAEDLCSYNRLIVIPATPCPLSDMLNFDRLPSQQKV